MLSLLFAASLFVTQAPDTAHVVLVATTDVHGRATAWDYLADRAAPGGLTRVATVVDSLRRRFPGQVVVLDAGDMLQGNAFAAYHARAGHRGANPIVEAMNLVGYDAATPGNHDFDWGVPELERALTDAAFPYVSANLFRVPSDSLLVSPFRVLRRGPIRVGVTGFTTPGVAVWDGDRLRGRIRVERIESAASRTFAAVRRSSDLVVALAHSGIAGPSSYDTTGVGAEDVAGSFATMAARPDVVIVGHSHDEVRDSMLGEVRYVQPKPYAESVAVVHVDMVRPPGREWRVGRVRTELISTAEATPSEVMEQRLRPAHDAVREWVGEAVGMASAPMPAAEGRARPTPLIDWMLEVQRRRAGATLAAGPVFDLRALLPGETIHRRDLLRLYPYENTLRAVKISGAQLKDYLERSARYFRVDAAGRISINDSMPGYDFDLVRGARYDIDLRQPVGGRIRNLAVAGRPVAPSDSFTMALNSHRQSGAGGYSMVAHAPVVYDRGEWIRELLEQDLAGQRLDPARVVPSTWRIVPEMVEQAVFRIYGVAPAAAPVSSGDNLLLRVFSTAGLHGRLDSAGAVAGAMDSLSAACGCPTLRLDGGGAVTGRTDVPVLNAMRVVASALAERDFDRPADSLPKRVAESRFSWLAANVFDSATGRRPAWLTQRTILDSAGLRVAILGYVTPDTKQQQPPERTAGLRFGAGELGLHATLAEARSAKPSLTILIAHAGEDELAHLAGELRGSGVGLILGGDGVDTVQTRIGGIPVLSAAGPGSLAIADLVKTAAGGVEVRTRIERIEAGPAPAGTPMAATLDTFARRRDSLARRTVAQLKSPLARAKGGQALGGMIAEARRNLARADLGLVRADAIKADLPAGPVTLARLRAVEPARADIVRLTLSGTQIQAVLERALEQGDHPSVHLAGGVVRYDPQAPAGRRLREIVLAGGTKLKPKETYTLATDDATAAGAGGFAVLAGAPVERVGLLDAETVAAYLRRLPQPVEVGASSAFQSTRR